MRKAFNSLLRQRFSIKKKKKFYFYKKNCSIFSLNIKIKQTIHLFTMFVFKIKFFLLVFSLHSPPLSSPDSHISSTILSSFSLILLVQPFKPKNVYSHTSGFLSTYLLLCWHWNVKLF